MEPEVKFHSIGIISDDFEEISTPLPVDENQIDRVLFTLKEGSRYQLKLTFSVLHNIVSGLTYSNTVWKGGLQGTKTVWLSSLDVLNAVQMVESFLKYVNNLLTC